jgi:trimeric autotransporter adhesin
MCSRKWFIVALVACALASACSNYNTNLSIQTSSSVLAFVSPSTATVGAQGFTITANGSGFTTGALILWNSTALTTTLVSSGQLTAPVPASDLTTAGTVKVSVQIPGSAQSATSNVNNTTTTEVSNIVLFTIGATPGTPPAITSLSASTTSAASTPYCSTQGFTLTVNGTNFTSDAVVNWNGTAQTTTFASATQLTASIPATDTAFPGTVGVTVKNSIGASNSLPLTLSTPATALAAPSISSLSQTSVAVGSPTLTLTVTDTNTLPFLPCSVVQWVSPGNVTTTLPTTFVSATQLVATVPAADFLAVGTAQVEVFTLGPGGGTSGQIQFAIVPPAITSLSSSTTSSNTTPSCSPSVVTLTVTGTNFVNGSVVDWVISPPPALPSVLATTFVSTMQLTATIPVSDIVSTGAVNIQVSNFGALSNPLPFTISAASLPAPAIASISPATATAGTAGTTLIVTGTNLLSCSVAQWTSGGVTTQLATTYSSATQTNQAQLNAAVPAADIASVGMAQIAVASPASSANTSNSVSFPIILPTIISLSASTTSSNSAPFCSPTGLTLGVTGTGFANGLVVNWNGSPRPTTFLSPTQLNAAITAADTAFLSTGAAAVAITVSAGGPGTNSNSLKFPVTALPAGTNLPSPAISSNSILPSSAAMEALTGPPVALTVNGNSLSPCSVVQWNGVALPTSIFIGTSGMTSIIPAANLTAVGTDQVNVVTPTPGGGASINAPFAVFMPGSPSGAVVSGGALSLPLMSSDQRYAVYVLASTDGATEVPGSTQNIFVSDTCLGVASGCTPSTTLVSTGMSGTLANGDSISPSISAGASADGRYVSFLSSATNLVASDTNGAADAFVRDTCAGGSSGCTPSTQLVSVTTSGTQANGATTSATIDATGRYITFESQASNLGSISSSGGIFLRDTCAGAPAGCAPSTQPLN